MEFVLLAFIAGLVLGLAISNILTNLKWMNNAYVPYKILENRKFFKVTEIDNIESWCFSDVHRPSDKKYKEYRKKNGWCDI